MEFSSQKIIGEFIPVSRLLMLYLLLLYIYMVSKKVLSLHKVLFNNNCVFTLSVFVNRVE